MAAPWGFTITWDLIPSGCAMGLCGKGEASLSSQEPHGPAGDDGSAQKHGETIKAVADHVTRGLAVGDAEHDGREEGEPRRGAEVAELDRHCFFPMAM